MAVAGAALTAAVTFYSGWQALTLSLSVEIAQPLFVVGIAWLFGNGARTLAERNGQLAVLTAQLHREQQDRARRAVTEERVRIARELHDVVAHHMSVISVQVGLAEYVFASDPPTARTALSAIAEAGREAQEEMRHLLAALRIEPDESEDRAPAPGLGRFNELVDRVRASGLPVGVVVIGEPRQLPPHLDLCVYRIIQESLTNVLKHAGPARATVTLEYRPGQINARIADDGQGSPPADGEAGGHGLIGMRERVRLYGGTISAGPRPQGGFEVTLSLPTTR
jgi:signal transduction histidine kinase